MIRIQMRLEVLRVFGAIGKCSCLAVMTAHFGGVVSWAVPPSRVCLCMFSCQASDARPQPSNQLRYLHSPPPPNNVHVWKLEILHGTHGGGIYQLSGNDGAQDEGTKRSAEGATSIRAIELP